jgi:transposase
MTLRLVGTIPPEVWNRLGTKVIPKLKAGADLSVGVEFSVSFNADIVSSTVAELRQILNDLGLEDRLKIKQRSSSSYSGFPLIIRDQPASLSGMASYSSDLRQRILHACEHRLGSQQAMANIFGVSLSCVEKLLRRHRTTGAMAPKPHGGGQRPRLDAAAQAQVRRLVHEQPDATLAELCTRAVEATGIRVSVPTMCRVVRRLGLPRQNNRSTRRSATPSGSGERGKTTRP